MLSSGYKVLIIFDNGHIVTKHFRCNSKYDLFAYIGYLYSTVTYKINRIEYFTITDVNIKWDLSVGDLKLRYESVDKCSGDCDHCEYAYQKTDHGYFYEESKIHCKLTEEKKHVS